MGGSLTFEMCGYGGGELEGEEFKCWASFR